MLNFACLPSTSTVSLPSRLRPWIGLDWMPLGLMCGHGSLTRLAGPVRVGAVQTLRGCRVGAGLLRRLPPRLPAGQAPGGATQEGRPAATGRRGQTQGTPPRSVFPGWFGFRWCGVCDEVCPNARRRPAAKPQPPSWRGRAPSTTAPTSIPATGGRASAGFASGSRRPPCTVRLHAAAASAFYSQNQLVQSRQSKFVQEGKKGNNVKASGDSVSNDCPRCVYCLL